MPTPVETTPVQTLSDADLRPRGRVHPSPATWRDQFFYFLLPDRFCDSRVAERPLFDWNHPEQHATPSKRLWQLSGKGFQGGTLKGVATRLDYLKNLGVTTLWIGPVWRQRPDLDTYHGYGIQNFLDVDPRFGTLQDLRDLVDAAHDRGMYILLDVIYNHSGNNWFYDDSGIPKSDLPYRYAPPYPVHGWRSARGESLPRIDTLDDGVWPREFQDLEWYTRAGRIGRWDPEPWEDPLHPDNEFRRGDFFDLKDINLNRNPVLSAVIRAYQYWIALSDCDGFRIDTVKHLTFEGSRNFCGAIREYAESIGKENFFLVGEVTGGAAMSRDYLDIFGRNLDAALDIGQPTRNLSGMAKGLTQPAWFFNQFSGHDLLGSHRETGRYHISILDDHDMVGREGKHRFAARNPIPNRLEQVAHAVGIQLTTLGIPCLYYGTEQAFDGTEDRHDPAIDSGFEDRYIRETMFGGTFGAFATSGCHFFDPHHPAYLRIGAIARIRNQNSKVGLALRRGRQYPRETSFLGRPFSIPGAGELVAWSRILFDREVLVVLNTNGAASRGADVTVDAAFHPSDTAEAVLTFLYRGDWSDAELRDPPRNRQVAVRQNNGRATVRIDLPPASMAILA
ncbi:MAG: alpha-amylase family glycosyl hydrolase [Candidatus Manganitrophaceae bacterium]